MSCVLAARASARYMNAALGITCDKVPMAKMITVKDISIISQSFPLDWARTSTDP